VGDHQIPAWRDSAHHALALGTLVKTEVDERLTAALGHSLADNEALANLRDAGRSLRMGEIAARLTLSAGGVTKLVDRLERAGHVSRAPDPDDRRATRVEITSAGLAMLDRARPIIVEALWEVWGRHITEEEAGSLLQVFARIAGGNDWFG
jgi:DNA-binding MarR family transcriptional regulator